MYIENIQNDVKIEIRSFLSLQQAQNFGCRLGRKFGCFHSNLNASSFEFKIIDIMNSTYNYTYMLTFCEFGNRNYVLFDVGSIISNECPALSVGFFCNLVP